MACSGIALALAVIYITTGVNNCCGLNVPSTKLACGLVIIVLAIGPKVCGFKHGRGKWIFKGNKNPLHDFF
jgi:hypothetical protein